MPWVSELPKPAVLFLANEASRPASVIGSEPTSLTDQLRAEARG